KELRRNLNGEHVTIYTQRHNGFEPGVEIVYFDLFTNNFQTVIPNSAVSYFHRLYVHFGKGSDIGGKGDKDGEKEFKKSRSKRLDFLEKKPLIKFRKKDNSLRKDG